MALSSFDLLGPVVSALCASYHGGLDRLAVYYAGAGLRVPLQTDPHPLAQGRVHPLPGSIQTPETEVGVRVVAGGEVGGKQAGGKPAANDVEDGVEDLAGAMRLGTSGEFGDGQVRFEEAPFGVGEIDLICCSHARHPTERVPQSPFSDGFEAKFA